MPAYRRPSLLTADMVEVSEHLLSKGIHSSIGKDETAMIIVMSGTSAELTTALADFPNLGFYRTPLPTALQTHTQHLVDFLAATPAQLAALTQAQRDHALQDVVRALKLIVDDRLG